MVFAVLLPAAACGRQGEPAPPPLPPLQLRPATPDLQRLAAAASPAAAEAQMREWRDLIAAAYGSGEVDQRLRGRAKLTLEEDTAATPALEAALADPDPSIRALAAFELGRRGQRASLVPLLRQFRYERDPAALVWITDALAHLGCHAGLPMMAWLFGQEAVAESAGQNAVRILRDAGRDPGASPSWEILRQGLDALHRHWRDQGVAAGTAAPAPDPQLTARMARLLLDLKGFQLRPVDEACHALARLGVAPLPLLRHAVQAEEDYIRDHGLEIVRDLGRPARELAKDLLALLAHPRSRLGAMRALGEVGVREALPHLLAALRDPDPEVRTTAAGALGPLGDPDAVAALAPWLEDAGRTADERVYAAYSLALLEKGGRGLAYLQARQNAADYHAPTIQELLDKIAAATR